MTKESKSKKAKRIITEILKWITVIPGLVQLIMNATKKEK